jgi:hypothetical protein
MSSKTNYRRELKDLAREHGATISSPGGHFLLVTAAGRKVFASSSPRTPEVAIKKTRSLLKKVSHEQRKT